MTLSSAATLAISQVARARHRVRARNACEVRSCYNHAMTARASDSANDTAPALRGGVAALRDKYLELQRLRIEHDAGESEDPRPRLRALSARFPGALRELDELPMEQIEARLATLHAVLARTQPAPPWIALQLGYHGWMRAALCIKRIAAERSAIDADALLVELASRYQPDPHEPPLTAIDRAAIVEILEPADGRLNPWVFARVARDHGVESEIVQRALFTRGLRRNTPR
jgi:hypothetical protein